MDRLRGEVGFKVMFTAATIHLKGGVSAFVARTTAELNASGLAIHLVGNSQTKPPGWTAAIETLQMNASVQRFGDEKSRIVIWQYSPKSFEPPVDAIKVAQILKGTGFEYLDSLISELSERNSRELPPDDSARQVGRRYVYVECVKEDLNRLGALRAALEPLGVRVRTPLFDGDEAKLASPMRNHRRRRPEKSFSLYSIRGVTA